MTGSMTGRVLNNRYAVADRVGLGGMAEVYRATDKVLGRPVAVKVMLPQYAEDETFTKRFRQEAASAANLQSPYIVSVYDWGQDDGQYFIVMEFVNGSDLKTGISQRGAINQRKVAEIGSQVCQALSVAHKNDIIHRDIKPQNIMVQPDGNVKVMDFGIARAKNAGLTQTSSVLGTAHYISPEQAQGKELSPASDIYSLGVCMYEAATGVLPFDGPDAVSVAMKQVSENPEPPSVHNPNIDPTLEAIIMKAMAKNPQDRFASALDMRHALNDFLAGRPVAGLDMGFANANTQFMGGAVVPPMSGATAVMPGIDQPVANTVSHNATKYSSNTASNPPVGGGGGKSKAFVIVATIAALAIIGAAAFFIFGGTGNPVPNVTGKNQTEATKLLEDADFKVGTITTANSATVPEGAVISQDPSAGSRKEAGTRVNLVVSAGVEQITIPDLTGMTAEQAQAALSKLGLTAVAGKADYSSNVESGKIMSQEPAAGTTAAKGTTVQYCLSLGAETISVPSVINYSQSQAVSTLEGLGFVVKIETGTSDKVDSGSVYQQDPASGKLEKGQTVTIYVSKGSDKVEVPYVVGDTLKTAIAELKAAGFQASISGPEDSSAIVVSQSNSDMATKGSTITLKTTSGGGDNTNTSTSENSSSNTFSSSQN